MYLGARDPERGATAAKSLGATLVAFDVADDASAITSVDEAEGVLDVLINNAGITGACTEAGQ